MTSPNARALRRDFLTRRRGIAAPGEDLRVLEIGALDGPTYRGEEGRGVKYLDYFSREESQAMHAKAERRTPENFVEVDYVVKGKRFAADVPARFDLIIAHHVIEHIPDPLTWLGELRGICEPWGALLLAIPDRRYTFDYLRPESTAVDLWRAQLDDLEAPDLFQVMSSFYYFRALESSDVSPGPPPPEKLAVRRFPWSEAEHRARHAVAVGYADVHCSVFSAPTFPTLVDDLRDAELLAWRIESLEDVPEGLNEFHVLLAPD